MGTHTLTLLFDSCPYPTAEGEILQKYFGKMHLVEASLFYFLGVIK